MGVGAEGSIGSVSINELVIYQDSAALGPSIAVSEGRRRNVTSNREPQSAPVRELWFERIRRRAPLPPVDKISHANQFRHSLILTYFGLRALRKMSDKTGGFVPPTRGYYPMVGRMMSNGALGSL